MTITETDQISDLGNTQLVSRSRLTNKLNTTNLIVDDSIMLLNSSRLINEESKLEGDQTVVDD